MRRVLVTGASTPVGLAVAARLSREPGVERVLAVQRPGEAPVGLEDLAQVRVVEVDLTRPRQVHGLLFGAARHEGCNAILHLAAHRAARDEGNRVHALNVDSTRQLLDLAQRQPTIKRFVLRSYAEVYRVRPHHAVVLREGHPLELSPAAPQWIRDRVEADLIACSQMGEAPVRVANLRCAECPAPHNGSQLWEYLHGRVCFAPLGYDPMLNLISISDLADALTRAVLSDAVGVYNIPGADTYPLSVAIRRAGRTRIPVPARYVSRLYSSRMLRRGSDFRYDQNHFRFRFSGVLDGARAADVLGYVPRCSIEWDAFQPRPPAAEAANAAAPALRQNAARV